MQHVFAECELCKPTIGETKHRTQNWADFFSTHCDIYDHISLRKEIICHSSINDIDYCITETDALDNLIYDIINKKIICECRYKSAEMPHPFSRCFLVQNLHYLIKCGKISAFYFSSDYVVDIIESHRFDAKHFKFMRKELYHFIVMMYTEKVINCEQYRDIIIGKVDNQELFKKLFAYGKDFISLSEVIYPKETSFRQVLYIAKYTYVPAEIIIKKLRECKEILTAADVMKLLKIIHTHGIDLGLMLDMYYSKCSKLQ